MKLSALILASLLPAAVLAQDATPTPKPSRHFLFFHGNKTPEAESAPAPKPTATPKPADKKTTPKPKRKVLEKPAETPSAKNESAESEKPATQPPQTFGDKPSELTLEKPASTAVAPLAPAPLPAATPPQAPPAPLAIPAPIAAGEKTEKAEKPAAKLSARTTAKSGAHPEKAETPSPKPVEKPPAPASPSIVTSTVPPEPAQIVRAFFSMVSEGNIEGAYANLMKGSKIAERPEEVRLLKAKTHEAVDVFGSVHGYDLVDSKPVGMRLVRATYISLGHDYPLRWRFYFYRSEDVWKLIDIRVDDKLTGIFDEQDEPRGGAESK